MTNNRQRRGAALEARPYPGASIESAASATSSTGVEVEAFMTLGAWGTALPVGLGGWGQKKFGPVETDLNISYLSRLKNL